MNRLNKNNMRLIVLLGLSLAIHLTLFSAFNQSDKNSLSIVPPSQQGGILVIALKRKSNSSTLSKTTSTTKTHANKIIAETKFKKTSKTSSKDTKVNVVHSELTNSNKPTLISQIKSEFSQHFKYPLLARRKGWQGKVLLTMNVSNVGVINNIKIKNSSGYKILDNAAKRSLAKIDKINISANIDLPHSTYLQLPVIYKLTEG